MPHAYKRDAARRVPALAIILQLASQVRIWQIVEPRARVDQAVYGDRERDSFGNRTRYFNSSSAL